MTVLETNRLVVRRLVPDDAAFVMELVNDPAWLQFIGDRGVRNLTDARAYLEKGPLAMYERFGFGLFCVERKEDGTPIGMCGLLQRDTLPDTDLGFAFLPQFRGRGYAFESANGMIAHAKKDLGKTRLVALTDPLNHASISLLEKLGFVFEKKFSLPPYPTESNLFSRAL